MNQTIYSGDGAYRTISEILAAIGTRKLLLVCGNSFDRQFLAEEILNLPVSIVRFSEITPNPKYEEVCSGLRVFQQSGCDTILAIGGGSCLDVAKCIKLFCKMPESENYLQQPRKDTGIPMIAIPTTAGTGSESTQHAVIYYQGVKQSVSHLSLVPEYVILEPALLKSLPDLQRKCPMLDALCHAIESYWSKKATKESKAYASEAIRMILQNLDAYLANTDAGNARMLEAANLAGKAINITATTAGHAMSYKLSSLYHIPHGYACALCLTVLWPYLNANMDLCTHPEGESYLRSTVEELAALFQTSNKTSVSAFRALLDSLQLPEISANDPAEIAELTKSVNPERLGNFPIALTPDVIAHLYTKLLYKEVQTK